MDAILTRDDGIVPEPLLGLLEAAELVHSNGQRSADQTLPTLQDKSTVPDLRQVGPRASAATLCPADLALPELDAHIRLVTDGAVPH